MKAPNFLVNLCAWPRWRCAAVAVGIVALFTLTTGLVSAADNSGAAVYKEECASCHGKSGQGTKKYPQALIGERSLPQLAAVIGRTMPDDDPGSCTNQEVSSVAAYIYDAFYSIDARARLNPPRVELSHLTVGQYRNSIADIIGAFRFGSPPSDKQGLHGQYFNARNTDQSKRLIDRLDPQVKFDFNETGPEEGSATFNPSQFCIRWDGSVLALETGVYEFVLRSNQAAQLFINDPRKPLIDAMVQSKSDTEHRASILLLGGRTYTLRLEFYKHLIPPKKGEEPKPEDAAISLLWKRPHMADEIIPARALSPARSAEVAVLQTPFPPDDRSYGWERGTIVSKEWYAATTDAALEVAEYVADHLAELSNVTDSAPDRESKLRDFCQKFAERAFRRPLSADEKKEFIDNQFAPASDLETAVKRAVIAVLASPRFLYPETSDDQAGSYGVAARLALALWDSTPDEGLRRLAAAGALSTRQQIAAQAERMLADPRARAKVRQFMMAWLRVDQFPEIVKDASRFPGFDANAAADLRTSLELFLDDIVWSDSSDLRQLFLSDDYYLNGRLAALYGVQLPGDADFTKVRFEPGQRAGVLTHPYMLSVLAYPAESSPIHRGVFIGRGLLGITLRPPPSAFSPLPPELHPDLTTRERITLQTSQTACVRCHGVINPLGFALENFDAVGRWRSTEKGKPLDDTGFYETRAGPTAKFAGAQQLAAYLAGSDEVQASFSQQLFQHLTKQPVRAYGLQKPHELQEFFAANGWNVRKLLVEIAVTAAQAQTAAPQATTPNR